MKMTEAVTMYSSNIRPAKYGVLGLCVQDTRTVGPLFSSRRLFYLFITYSVFFFFVNLNPNIKSTHISYSYK